MPIYEYKCSECGNVYEKRQKFSDPVDTVCNCEKQAPVIRLTSAPALVFKGSGWYINDYARAGKGTNGKSEGKGETGGSAKDDSGSKSSSDTPSSSPESSKSSKSSSDSNSGSSSDSSSKPEPAVKST